MADRNQLLRLSRGVAAWNKWRLAEPFATPDLLDADLTTYSLSRRVPDDLPEDAETTIVVFSPGADFTRGSLNGIKASGKQIVGADFTDARLRRADLRGTSLWDCDFTQADLEDADLSGAWIRNSVFTETNLRRANFADVTLASCAFAAVDLADVHALETVKHQSPSSVGVDTLYSSAGRIPVEFLSGCGIPQHLLEYLPSFVSPDAVVRFYSCFISYSSADQEFADRLYADLRRIAVRCWLASEDIKIGGRIRTRIDDAIRVYDKLLLVLSEASLTSQWVEHEVESALEKERREGRTVLFPVRLDDAVMRPVSGWPALVRNTRHIGDFRDWRNYESYKRAFERLKRDAKVE